MMDAANDISVGCTSVCNAHVTVIYVTDKAGKKGPRPARTSSDSSHGRACANRF